MHASSLEKLWQDFGRQDMQGRPGDVDQNIEANQKGRSAGYIIRAKLV